MRNAFGCVLKNQKVAGFGQPRSTRTGTDGVVPLGDQPSRIA
jgi:hypothetical protein